MTKKNIKTKRYVTVLLDEAAFYKVNGLRYDVKAIKKRRGEWSFEHTEDLEKLRMQFWTGNPSVKLVTWINTRMQMKYEQQAIVVDTTQELAYPSGTLYYYISGDKVLSSYFGKSLVHEKRLAEENFFTEKNEALAKLNEK